MAILITLAYYAVISGVMYFLYNYIATELNWTHLSFWVIYALVWLAHLLKNVFIGSKK